MKRWFILLFVLLFGVGFVLAAEGWGDINTGGDGDVTVGDAEDAEEMTNEEVKGEISRIFDGGGVVGSERKYTRDFYIALGVAGVGILIVLFFVYLFLRRPKNKWKNRKIVRNVLAVNGENSKVVKSKIL